MKRIIVYTLLILSCFCFNASAEEKNIKITINLSNQSFERPNEKIKLLFDKKEVFNDNLPIRDQHHFLNFDFKIEKDQIIDIRVVAVDSQIESYLSLEPNQNKYIFITFNYDNESERSFFLFAVRNKKYGID
ncbi:MAG: hypothetical protein KJ711_07560 [Candidatus Omnitrophica bacterium]|nr:hypothetical protein [Candidatus Omnitrophota bacterium]MBU1524721.1 hypothetical protein [Candidatus Omnitrophota bacterium]